MAFFSLIFAGVLAAALGRFIHGIFYTRVAAGIDSLGFALFFVVTYRVLKRLRKG